MAVQQEARLVKLRETESGPIFGVRTRLACSCGAAFFVTLTAGVNRPAIWCPRCQRRSHLQVVWRLDDRLEEGALVRFSVGGGSNGS